MQISMGQFNHSIYHYVTNYGGRHICCISLNKYKSCCSLTKFLPLGEKIHFVLDPTFFFKYSHQFMNIVQGDLSMKPGLGPGVTLVLIYVCNNYTFDGGMNE